MSAGSELLVYRGELPDGMVGDEVLPALNRRGQFPIRYGYAAVGRVVDLGADVAEEWAGRLVFAFQPHGAEFTTPVETLLAVPDGINPEDAAIYPNVETALTLVLDSRPLAGERVVVLGQGVVGLLTIALLGRFPLDALAAIDGVVARQTRAASLGATWTGAPSEVGSLRRHLGPFGADLAIELSGRPEALDLAIGLVGFAGRVVVGSWYGTKRATLDLGGRFHRDRLTIVSSQVSTIGPALGGRWDRARRTAFTWDLVRAIRPSILVTDRIPVEDAPTLYHRLDEGDPAIVQALFTYDGG